MATNKQLKLCSLLMGIAFMTYLFFSLRIALKTMDLQSSFFRFNLQKLGNGMDERTASSTSLMLLKSLKVAQLEKNFRLEPLDLRYYKTISERGCHVLEIPLFVDVSSHSFDNLSPFQQSLAETFGSYFFTKNGPNVSWGAVTIKLTPSPFYKRMYNVTLKDDPNGMIITHPPCFDRTGETISQDVVVTVASTKPIITLHVKTP